MADEMKFSVLIQLVDRISDKLKSIGGGIGGLGQSASKSADRLGALGERMVNFGAKMALTTALISEGANTLHEWTKAISEPAMAMEHSFATMAAMTGLGGKALGDIREHAVAFSNTHPGATAEQWADGFTRLRGVYQDTAKAMKAEDVAAQLQRFGVDTESATRLFGVAQANFGASAQTVGDQLLRTTQVFGVSSKDVGRFAMAMGRLGGVAQATKTPLAEMMAVAGQANIAFGGGRGMGTFVSAINELVSSGKSGVDWSHGINAGLEQLRAHIANLPHAEQLKALKDAGAGETGASPLLSLLTNLDKARAGTSAVAASAGTLGKSYTTATSDASDQIQLLHQNVSNLYDKMFTSVLPIVNRWMGDLTGLTQSATSATEHHSTVARDVAISVTAMGGAGYYGVHALSALGTASVFAGDGLKFLRKLPAYGSNIAKFGSRLLDAIPSILSFGAALLANPLTWYIAGAVALGYVAYEIYEHWGHLGEWFSSMWTRLKGIFSGFSAWIPGWAKGFGSALLIGITGPIGMIAGEISKHWDAIKASCEKLAGGIKGFFVGHSPPPFGPLHDLGHVSIAETIADRIRPAPFLAAITRTAAAVAIAAPLMAMPAVAAFVPAPSPRSAVSASGATAPGGPAAITGASGAAPIINYSVAINGSGLSEDQLLHALETHAYELRRILSREDARRERTELK